MYLQSFAIFDRFERTNVFPREDLLTSYGLEVFGDTAKMFDLRVPILITFRLRLTVLLMIFSTSNLMSTIAQLKDIGFRDLFIRQRNKFNHAIKIWV